MSNFADRLQVLKKRDAVTQVQLIKALGIGKKTLYNYEQGTRMPPAETLIALADYFDVSLDYLVGRTDDPSRPPPAGPE